MTGQAGGPPQTSRGRIGPDLTYIHAMQTDLLRKGSALSPQDDSPAFHPAGRLGRPYRQLRASGARSTPHPGLLSQKSDL